MFFRIGPLALHWLGNEPLDRFVRVFHCVLIPTTSREFCYRTRQVCLTLNDKPLVRSILSPSQTETTPLVTPTTLWNARPSHGICYRNRNLGGQCCARVRARASYNWPSLTSCIYSPIALGVFSASFFVVLASLLVISAQPTILRLVIFFYSASPLSRWAITRDYRRHLVSWYKSRRTARICVWIKDDDVCVSYQVSVSVLPIFLFLDLDSCHVTSTALRREERPRCSNSHICSRI